MKNKKSLLLISFCALLTLTTLSTNAMYDVNSGSGMKMMNNTGTGIRVMNTSMQQAKEAFKNTMQEQKELRKNMIEAEKEKKAQIKQNLLNFKNENKNVVEAFSGITEEISNELKVLRDQHIEDIKLIQEKLKNSNLTLEERDELKEELNAINNNYVEKIKELVANNKEASDFIQQREEIREQNGELRGEMKQAREEYREERNELVKKYKKTYSNTLAKAMPKIKAEKLEQVSAKINKLLETVEANTKISETNKEKLLSQIISLKEIMEEELELRNQEEEVINLDEIFE